MFIYNSVSDNKNIKQLPSKKNIVKTEEKKKKIGKKLTKKNQKYLQDLGFKIKKVNDESYSQHKELI